ncbi:MAG: hypothetical protein A2157_05500 [Deltaproteobacteria bacterium RBG_16_47_11]|nr:MAG: hypothetical protein A2157_05500 [Deltaproteobacteria bacterium RBG_16_47_11]
MDRKGITLVELVVVMAIIAIGAVLVAPSIGAWIPNYRLRGATRDIVSTLRTAQMRAVATNLEYRVDFDVGGKSFILQYQTTAGLQDEGSRQFLPTGVTFVSATFSGSVSHAVFNPNSTSSAGSVLLRNSRGTQRTVTLTSSTGRAKID